jgi:hypothetical protein
MWRSALVGVFWLMAAAPVAAGGEAAFASKWSKWRLTLGQRAVTGDWEHEGAEPILVDNAERHLGWKRSGSGVQPGDEAKEAWRRPKASETYAEYVERAVGYLQQKCASMAEEWSAALDGREPWQRKRLEPKNFRFLDWLGKKLGYADSTLFAELEKGVPTSQLMSRSGVYEEEDRQGKRRKVADEGRENPKIPQKPPEFMDKELRRAVEEKFKEHVENGLADGPHELDLLGTVDGAEYCMTFAVRQGSKIRIIHDGRPANARTGVPDRLRFPSHHDLVEAAHVWRLKGCRGLKRGYKPVQTRADYEERMNAIGANLAPAEPGLAGAVEYRQQDLALHVIDFSGAFEQLVTRCRRKNIAIVWDEKKGKYVFYYCYFAAFGFLTSLWYFCRLSNFFNFVFRELLFGVNYTYVDDIFGVMLRMHVEPYMAAVKAIIEMSGFRVADHKTQFGSTATILGIEFALFKFGIRLSAIPDKLMRLRVEVREMMELQVSKIGFGQVARIVGRVGHIVTVLKERGLRRFISPLFQLLDKDAFGARKSKLISEGFDFKRNLAYLEDGLETIRPLDFEYKKMTQPKSKLWTDADDPPGMAGKAGGICLVDGKYYYFIEEVPLEYILSIRAKKKIAAIEAVAVTMGAAMIKKVTRSCFVDVFIDNKTAFFGAMKSYSKDDAVYRWSMETNRVFGMCDCNPMYHYIATDWNPADGCTREDFLEGIIRKLGDIDATRVRVPFKSVEPRLEEK